MKRESTAKTSKASTAGRAQELQALWTGVNLLLSDLTEDSDTPLSTRMELDDSGAVEDESKLAVEDVLMRVEACAGMLRMAMAIAYPKAA